MGDTDTQEGEPCRHCGTVTTQRAEGVPYCSMDCISARRRELNRETLDCTYPDCGWSIEYNPDSQLQTMEANHKIDKHRSDHLNGEPDDGTEVV